MNQWRFLCRSVDLPSHPLTDRNIPTQSKSHLPTGKQKQAQQASMATNVDWQAKRQQAQEAARAAKDWTVTYVVRVWTRI